MNSRCQLVAVVLLVAVAGCEQEPASWSHNETFDYAQAAAAQGCPSPPPSAQAGRWDGIPFGQGQVMNVRAPANYRADVRHRLLVVFAAATQDATASEQFTGLTAFATARGYVLAYTRSKRLTRRHLSAVNEAVATVQQSWCIDPQRVYFTGHSDGGTTAVAQTFLPALQHRPTAIAPSAAGFSAAALADIECPAPTPAMVQGLGGDTLFPGYARDLADWFAACNACDPALPAPAAGPCTAYRNCSKAATVYCEIPGPHRKWPSLNRQILDFFERT